MSDEAVTKAKPSPLDFIAEHRRRYIDSGGTEGHIIDLGPVGGLGFTTHLLIETVGRKSGARRVTTLIYAIVAGEVVVIASKGGADVHPAWYLNLVESPEVRFQIGTQAFRGSWREPADAEREAVWAIMERNYPPYDDYRKATGRRIPVVMMTAIAPIDLLKD